ncbi:MAG: FkbM family methyltransferase [Methylobacter sp.]
MRFQAFMNRLDKLSQTMLSKRLLLALFRHRVLAGAEHRNVLSRDLATVVDIGANRGQFALAARQWAPKARVISFEPLNHPVALFRRVFAGDDQVILHQSAIGPESMRQEMHVSARDDSSSLLPISSLQSALFPGTEEVSTTEVRVAPLAEFVSVDDLQMPAMLKLDVQGFEFDALRGCESLLERFDWVYCECSFVELYSGQKLAWEVIDWLSARGFCLMGMFNTAYDQRGQAVQADFLFCRKDGQGLVNP